MAHVNVSMHKATKMLALIEEVLFSGSCIKEALAHILYTFYLNLKEDCKMQDHKLINGTLSRHYFLPAYSGNNRK